MVAAIFCTETSCHVNYSVSNQHWKSSRKPLQWIQCTEQIYIQMLKLSRFYRCAPTFMFLRTLLCNLRRWSVLLIFVLQKFSWCHSPIYFVCSPLSSLETFRNICVTLCCKGILLNIGLNLRYSQYSKSVISLLTKKAVSCVKLFSLKNFILSLNEAPKAHYFCFLLLKVLLFSKNQIKLLCQTPKLFLL